MERGLKSFFLILLIRLIRCLTHWLVHLELRFRTALPWINRVTVLLPESKRRIPLMVSGELGKTVIADGLSGYDPATARVWMDLCRHADVVLDIGAHIGLYSLLAADVNPDCRVYAFEPMPRNYRHLCHNLNAAGFQARTAAFELALSDQNGTSPLLLKGSCGATLSQAFWSFRHRTVPATSPMTVPVQTTTLDDWLRRQALTLTPSSVVKIDVEIHEPAVLRGALEALASGPALLCEVLSPFVEEELNRLLPPHRWHYFWIGPNGPVERDRIAGDLCWEYTNYLFLLSSHPHLPLIRQWSSKSQ